MCNWEIIVGEISAGLWEEEIIYLYRNYLIDDPEKICKHCSKIEYSGVDFKWLSNSNKVFFAAVKVTYLFPRVIIALNEGKNNSTAVCLDCLLEFLKIKEK